MSKRLFNTTNETTNKNTACDKKNLLNFLIITSWRYEFNVLKRIKKKKKEKRNMLKIK